MCLCEDYVPPSLDNTIVVLGDGLCARGMHLFRGDHDSLYTEIMLLSMEIMSLCL